MHGHRGPLKKQFVQPVDDITRHLDVDRAGLLQHTRQSCARYPHLGYASWKVNLIRGSNEIGHIHQPPLVVLQPIGASVQP